MNELYIVIEIATGDAEQQDLLIAQLNDCLEIDGFEQLDSSIKMFLKEQNFKEDQFKNIIQINNVKYKQSTINNENWNAKWESSFDPVLLNKFVAVRADFHSKIEDVEYEIIITPKMSFGTGHHATTTMMLESLKQYNPSGKSVIDFGTGTGVLAILAEKMGAKDILAIDYDDWSITNTAENMVQNNCLNISLQQADHFPVSGKWDIILANINLNVIIENMPALANGLKKDGILIISGILKENTQEILKAATDNGFETETINEKNNWLCLAFKKMHTD